jgi:hypothetical protein
VTAPDPRLDEIQASRRATTLDRFWAKVDKSAECWVWTGKLRADGYGNFWDGENKRMMRVHRFAYLAEIGDIPDGLQLDHLCRNRACVNPAHLEPVSARENTLRGVGLTAQNAVKTHCPRNHPLTGDNLFLVPAGRSCRECRREAVRRWRSRRRAA